MSERIACIQCDLPQQVGALAPGQRATCCRCGHLLSSPSPRSFSRALALAIAALTFLALANAFPFLSLEAKGLTSEMTLPRSALVMHRDGYTVLAVIVLGVIVVVPTLVMLCVAGLVLPLERGVDKPWLVAAGRALFLLSPWSMAEVFIIGVIVSLVKIAHMAHVVVGLAFWSYAAFVVCFIAAMSSLDRLEIWERIEACRS